MKRRLLAVAWLALLPATAFADEEVLEHVVVRNRLFTVRSKPELSASLGLSLVDRLTTHTSLNVGAAFNLTETLGVEVRAGYSFSGHTGLARQISDEMLNRSPSLTLVDDLANLWEMRGNLVGGFRWMPIYGKISLLSDLPVHFQTYLWLGGGVGTFHRQSMVYCLSTSSGSHVGCDNWLTEDRVSPLGSAALGMRFFTGARGVVHIELRDYAYADSYRVGINLPQAETGDKSSGSAAASPAWTQLFMVDVGYSFIF